MFFSLLLPILSFDVVSLKPLYTPSLPLSSWTWGKYFFHSLMSNLFFPSLKFAYLAIFNFPCFDCKKKIKMVLLHSEMPMKFRDLVCPCFMLILSVPRMCEFNFLSCDFKDFWIISLNEDFVTFCWFSFVQMLFISHNHCFLNYCLLLLNILFSLLFLSEPSSSCCICLKSFLVKILQTQTYVCSETRF